MIIDIFLAILYIIVAIVVFLIILAFAIPAGILYGLYWILFKSWRRKKTRKRKKRNGKHKSKKSDFNPKAIRDIVKKSIAAGKSGSNIDEDELREDIKDYVDKANQHATENNED